MIVLSRFLGITLLVLLFSGDIKEKKEKKSSKNDQSTGHFQSFFILLFRPPTLDLKKNSRKSTNKKNLALIVAYKLSPCTQLSIKVHVKCSII